MVILKLRIADDDGKPVENPSVKMLYKILIDKKLVSTFPNVEVAMRIYLSLMVSNATGERTFSRLKLIKSVKRTCMVQSRLTCLSLMSSENELLKNLDCEEIIDRFVQAKCWKNQCKDNRLWYSGFPSSWWYSVIIWELRMCTVNIWFFSTGSEVDMAMYYVSVKVHSELDLYINIYVCQVFPGICYWLNTDSKNIKFNHLIKNHKILSSTF